MQTSLFDFTLPPELIATTPLAKRDDSRLLVVDSRQHADQLIHDSSISALPSWLKAGDVLVLNNTKVMPARIFAKRGEAKIELLLHQQINETQWQAFAKPAKKLSAGDVLDAPGSAAFTVLEKLPDGQIILDTAMGFDALTAYLDANGQMPLPPYIQKHRNAEAEDRTRYQTVYSENSEQRSVAAPTAGLHFTDALLAQLENMGVEIVTITLHVGAGTFLPVKVDDTREHHMHSEQWQISEDAARRINQAKQDSRRVIAVGTTSLRTLEGACSEGVLPHGRGDTDIFITPGYQFAVADAMLTNFHLPKSTLFMLVSAFCGLERMQVAYQHAIAQQYRFYSYGDACLLLRNPHSATASSTD